MKLLRVFVLSCTVIGLCAIANLLAGCSLTSTVPEPLTYVVPAMEGIAKGGDTPINGASVILWETDPGNGGYGSTGAKQLATATTGTYGSFSFSGSYSCDTGQYLYITATGGSTNGNPVGSTGVTNNNYIELAGLGSCSHFDSAADDKKISIFLNEVTTVAAAYTLGNFISIDDTTPGSQLVHIGAPAANNATTGACTGTGGSMTCTAAGLGHAFANFANLVDAVHYNGTAPTGNALTTVPGNSLGSVPQAEINTLADVLTACTNSAGGTAGDGTTACGYLFTATTPTGGTAPTETLQAMINLAKYPSHNVGTSCTQGVLSGGVFCLVPAQTVFQPVLSSVPHDWSLAITYSGIVPGASSPYNASTATAFGVPLYLALDANDNVYVGASNTGTDASASTAGQIFAMGSNGAGIWATAPSTSNCLPAYVATDAIGDVYAATSVSGTSAVSPCVDDAIGYSTSNGAVNYTIYPASNTAVSGATICTSSTQPCGLSTPGGIGVDRFNNVWETRHASCSSNSCIVEFPFTASTGSGLGSFGTNAAGQTNALYEYGTQIITDAQGNIYEGIYQETNAVVSIVANTNTTGTRTSAPTYTAGSGSISASYPSTSSIAGYGLVALDASNNVYIAQKDAIVEFTPTTTSGAITGLNAGTTISSASFTPTEPISGEFDGGGRLWTPSYTSSGQFWFWDISVTSSNIQTEDLEPCYAPAGATTCGLASAYAKVVQVDSTGAVWAANSGASSTTSTPYYVQQLLGVGAPAWPQMSYGVFDTKPH